MKFQGDVASIPIMDVVQNLSANLKSGVLTVRQGDHVRRLFLKQGKLVSYSDNDGFSIPEWFHDKGFIDDDAFHKASKRFLKAKKKSFGEIVEQLGGPDLESWFRNVQNDDGGWGESCRSYSDPAAKAKGVSTPSQTAWAVLGLLASGASLADPAVRRLYILKQLATRQMWAGRLVHEAVERSLLALRDGHGLSESSLVEDTVRQMREEWKGSRAGIYRQAPKRPSLFEHEYAQPVEPEDKKIVVGTVMRSLRNFFRSDLLREVLALGRERWLTVEDLVSFEVSGTPVFLRMDLAYRDRDGRVVIVDWKTGRSEGRFNEVQMAGYALYAAQQGWVSAKWAPSAIFFSSRSTCTCRCLTLALKATPMRSCVGIWIEAPAALTPRLSPATSLTRPKEATS